MVDGSVAQPGSGNRLHRLLDTNPRHTWPRSFDAGLQPRSTVRGPTNAHSRQIPDTTTDPPPFGLLARSLHHQTRPAPRRPAARRRASSRRRRPSGTTHPCRHPRGNSAAGAARLTPVYARPWSRIISARALNRDSTRTAAGRRGHEQHDPGQRANPTPPVRPAPDLPRPPGWPPQQLLVNTSGLNPFSQPKTVKVTTGTRERVGPA